MSMRRWLLSGVLVAGCAGMHANAVPDAQVARLSPEARAEVAQSHHAIDVAQNNVETAKVQRDEALQFRGIAGSELRAATARQDAARSSLELARSSHDGEQLRIAQHDDDVAEQLVVAARAKIEYADRLAQLRQARLDESNAQLDVAHAQVNLHKARLVEREGIGNPDMMGLRNDEDATQQRLAQRRARVATLVGETQQLRTAWIDREHDLASRDITPMTPAPPARPMLPNPTLQGDVNDTPASPEMRQSQEPQTGIAPNP